jgi:hypothetical protein
VNSIGAFFKGSYDGMRLTTDRGRFTGATKPAQLFILLHETGHLTGALVPDRNNQTNVDKNDKTLEKECKDTVKKISKTK